MSQGALIIGTSGIETILSIFVAAFFAVSVIALFILIIRGTDANIAKNCREAAWMGFFGGLILLYLRFVLI